MKIEQVPVGELKFSEYNPRGLTETEFDQLKNSILKFGFVEPIVVNSNPSRKNVVIGGHQRLNVAIQLGMTHVPVFYKDISDLMEERELNLRLNKNIGHWDWNELANFDETELFNVGFTPQELNEHFLEWDSDIEKVEKEKETSSGIESTIKVICPQAKKDNIKILITNALTGYPDVRIE